MPRALYSWDSRSIKRTVSQEEKKAAFLFDTIRNRTVFLMPGLDETTGTSPEISEVLAYNPKKIYCIEKDPAICALGQNAGYDPRVKWIHGDIHQKDLWVQPPVTHFGYIHLDTCGPISLQLQQTLGTIASFLTNRYRPSKWTIRVTVQKQSRNSSEAPAEIGRQNFEVLKQQIRNITKWGYVQDLNQEDSDFLYSTPKLSLVQSLAMSIAAPMVYLMKEIPPETSRELVLYQDLNSIAAIEYTDVVGSTFASVIMRFASTSTYADADWTERRSMVMGDLKTLQTLQPQVFSAQDDTIQFHTLPSARGVAKT